MAGTLLSAYGSQFDSDAVQKDLDPNLRFAGFDAQGVGGYNWSDGGDTPLTKLWGQTLIKASQGQQLSPIEQQFVHARGLPDEGQINTNMQHLSDHPVGSHYHGDFDIGSALETGALDFATGGLYSMAKGGVDAVSGLSSNGKLLPALGEAAGEANLGPAQMYYDSANDVGQVNKTAGMLMRVVPGVATGAAAGLAVAGAEGAATAGEGAAGSAASGAPSAAALLATPEAAAQAGEIGEAAATGGAAIGQAAPSTEAGIADLGSAAKTGSVVGDIEPAGNPIGNIAKPPVPDNMQPGVDPEMTPTLSGATPSSIDQMAQSAFAPQTTVPASGSMTPADLSSMSTFSDSVAPSGNSLLSNPMTYVTAAGLAGQAYNMFGGNSRPGAGGGPSTPQTVPGADNPGANDPALHAQVESQVALQAKSFTDTLLTGGMGVRDWNQYSAAPGLTGYSPYGF